MKTLLSLAWKALPYLVAIALAWAAFAFVKGLGVSEENARRVSEVAELNATHEAVLADIDSQNNALLAKLQTEAREAEQRHQADMTAIDTKFSKERKDEKAIADRTIADLRTGAVRLRQRFATCAAPGDGGAGRIVPPAGTSTGLGDGAPSGGFGLADAELVFGIADESDKYANQLRACQAIVRKDRGQ